MYNICFISYKTPLIPYVIQYRCYQNANYIYLFVLFRIFLCLPASGTHKTCRLMKPINGYFSRTGRLIIPTSYLEGPKSTCCIAVQMVTFGFSCKYQDKQIKKTEAVVILQNKHSG